jgi:hypothetical protein
VELVQGSIQEEVEKVTKNEIVQKSISLSFDFLRHIVKNPDLLEAIPDNAEVQFVESDLPVPVEQESAAVSCNTVLFKVEHIFKAMPELQCGGESLS